MTLASAFLVFESVGGEPFIDFHAADAWLQLFGAGTVATLWFCWIAMILRRAWLVRRLDVLSLLGVAWAAFAVFWMLQVPTNYVADRQRAEERLSSWLENCDEFEAQMESKVGHRLRDLH
ncbi:MAG: hypothetical protein A2289_00345 [Deltaproteobacteria bacterium RIFOXYA12_FULL_58_15]|nr:MAG: hypothetical protein A2289_00345 [Deltaproteobacteria bacterium RIFOXYA12_FULL_58_15]